MRFHLLFYGLSYISLAIFPARVTSDILPEKFHSDDVTLKRTADWLLLARETSSPSNNQSQTLHGFLWYFVIKMVFFCSNFRDFLSGKELNT